MNTAIAEDFCETAGLAGFLDESLYARLLGRAAAILSRESSAYLLEPTDLVHEAFLRIARSEVPVRFQSSSHVVALATIVMRRIMIDHARSTRWSRPSICIPLDPHDELPAQSTGDTLPLRDALERLAASEERLFRIVEMRVFGGFRVEEIASALDISGRTVKRDWNAAREWLQATLG